MDMTDITWNLREGIDPKPLQEIINERVSQLHEEREQRKDELQREREELRLQAQAQVEPFRKKLEEILGTEVPADAITITHPYPGFEPICRIGQIEEATDPSWRGDVWTRRDLIAVWNDGTIHIRVGGEDNTRRQDFLSPGTYKTWDAGPVKTTKDLARIIEQRGNTEWTPPKDDTPPAPEPEPESPVSPAERAQTLLEQLGTNPRNHRGLRGALIALAWSNLATRQD